MLAKTEVPDLPTGRRMVADIEAKLRAAMASMRAANCQPDWLYHNNAHYKLTKQKRAIQTAMGELVKQKWNNDNDGIA